MADLKSRLAPLFRRTSTSSAKSTTSATSNSLNNRSRTSLLSPKIRKGSLGGATVYEEHEDLPPALSKGELELGGDGDTSPETPRSPPLVEKAGGASNPVLAIQAPTPDLLLAEGFAEPEDASVEQTPSALQRPDLVPRRQSLAHSSQTKFLQTLLEPDKPQSDSKYVGESTPLSANMLNRKIWVKRSGASATLVSINEDDLVDDVRDRILKKYANSLGRSFDAPDVTLRIIPRSHRHSQGERILGPEEPIARTLDAYFPGGQTVEEALVIDVPRRTPRHSPRPYYVEDSRPVESGTDYFPIIPAAQQSPHVPSNISVASGHTSSHHVPLHAISVLNTGQVPPLPSPGGTRGARLVHRPKYGRTHTTSPTTLNSASGSQAHDSQKSHANGIPVPPPLPSPTLPHEIPHRTATPPARVSSPRPPKTTNKSSRKPKVNAPSLPTGLLDGAVPPINVLIVEDNIINLRLLEAFMKRLKVRWHTAMNGREAVTKWRAGGFHLVLMDIQLPVMNGLDATKEIRRLERLNNIGVFSGNAAGTPPYEDGTDNGEDGVNNQEVAEGEDSLPSTGMFKSPVIIVALTASSLQSDRHEALAAGCNDFLTKPVNFVWLERKVMEWGCMQALIDYDGWRKWKDINKATDEKDEAGKSPVSAKKSKPAKSAVPPSSGTIKRDKRLGGGVGMVVTSSGSGSEGMDVVASA
ncbi:MAG: hypothetical protein Q9195_007456 [Heterodermia aff. obscurata]